MDQGLEIEIIEYDTMYALETIKMWRASTEKVLGIKDKHTWTQQLDYLAEIVREYQVVLAIDHRTGTVIGMMAMAGSEVDHLYVHVDYQRRGIGTRLIELAKVLSPGMLRLYTFDVNTGAQAFYRKNGFRIIGRGVEKTSGKADIRYEWVRP